MKHRVFIVEDDPVIAREVRRHLETWGFEARVISDFQRVLQEFVAFDPHIVLMDISLPFFNGYHWCREIRKNSRVPVIFISSASENMNIVMAMDMGGDDFIAKPFSLDVLTAKVQAVLRRAYEFSGASALLEYGGVVLNLGDASLTYAEKRLELTRNDFRILQTLMERPGQIVSRETIMLRLWETDSFVDDNTLTVCMARLRKKLESVGLTDFIRTRKGAGYQVGEP